MGQKMYNVTIQGITKQYPEKIPYSEIVKEYEGSTDAPVMLVIVNGRLRELHKHRRNHGGEKERGVDSVVPYYCTDRL